MTSRICLAGIAVAALGVTLIGCENEAETMSRYPYFIKLLNERWGIIRESFASDSPNLNFAPVLLKDVSGTLGAMQRTYTGPNRDEAVKKLTELNKQLHTELSAQLVMRGGPVTLQPGATVEGVKASIDKAWKTYTEFQKLVELD